MQRHSKRGRGGIVFGVPVLFHRDIYRIKLAIVQLQRIGDRDNAAGSRQNTIIRAIRRRILEVFSFVVFSAVVYENSIELAFFKPFQLIQRILSAVFLRQQLTHAVGVGRAAVCKVRRRQAGQRFFPVFIALTFWLGVSAIQPENIDIIPVIVACCALHHKPRFPGHRGARRCAGAGVVFVVAVYPLLFDRQADGADLVGGDVGVALLLIGRTGNKAGGRAVVDVVGKAAVGARCAGCKGLGCLVAIRAIRHRVLDHAVGEIGNGFSVLHKTRQFGEAAGPVAACDCTLPGSGEGVVANFIPAGAHLHLFADCTIIVLGEVCVCVRPSTVVTLLHLQLKRHRYVKGEIIAIGDFCASCIHPLLLKRHRGVDGVGDRALKSNIFRAFGVYGASCARPRTGCNIANFL